MNHTPGPWQIRERLHTNMLWSIFGADDSLVVNLGDGGNGGEIQTANTKLIAEAPEYKRTLEAIAKMDHFHESKLGRGDCHGPCPICAAMDALAGNYPLPDE